jgi:acyl-CoA thioesterase I
MLKRTAAVLVLVMVSLLPPSIVACSSRVETPASVTTKQQPAAPRPSTAAARPRIVVLGDSLTAGLGLPADEAYPSLLQLRLDANGFNYEVVNAGVSGDTSAGGLSRLDWALEGDVHVLIVALGGNDALRALPADELKQNLSRIIERAQARHIAVVLAGMEAPPNFGRDYLVTFHQVYPSLAKQYHVAFLPFLLDGVAGNDALNQRDGIHPTAQGASIVANNVWTVLRPIVEEQRRQPTRKDGPTGS